MRNQQGSSEKWAGIPVERPTTMRRWLWPILAATAISHNADADFTSAYKNYREGKFAEASAEFMELAQLGHGASQFNLGAMSVRGEGTEKNTAIGVGWMLAALENGYDGMTAEKVSGFKNSLNTEQKAQADSVVARYGKAAIERNALPGTYSRTSACTQFSQPERETLAEPTYPLNALSTRQDGIVVLQFTVGIDGLARDPHVLIGLPAGIFEEPTIDAVLKSRFIPATRNGEKVAARETLRMTYSMEEGGRLWDVRAIKKISAAAELGDPTGMFIFGLLGTLDRTLNVPPDKARDMILSAAQAGHPQAQYWIAEQMEIARLCGGDDKRKLWLKPAARRDVNAQIDLVRMYLAATPEQLNIDEIKSLLSTAANSDSAYALKHVVALYAMPPVPTLADKAAALAAVPRLRKYDDSLDPHINEVMATAYAANGDFKNAVTQEERAIKKARKLYWNTIQMDERLAAYKESRVLTGNLFDVPPTKEPLPEVANEIDDCSKKKGGCGRRARDRLETPTGSHISH